MRAAKLLGMLEKRKICTCIALNLALQGNVWHANICEQLETWANPLYCQRRQLLPLWVRLRSTTDADSALKQFQGLDCVCGSSRLRLRRNARSSEGGQDAE